MRKNRMMRLASTLLVLTLLTTCAISGTFAKYTSEATGTDTARVAKWAFKVGDTNIATTAGTTVTFDLFDTVKDTAGSTEIDVKTGTGTERIIAPGTSGLFMLALKNESEVNAEYSIDYSVSNTYNIPVEFSVDGGTTWVSHANIDTLDVEDVAIVMDGGAANIIVEWRWAFTGSQSSNFTSTQTDATDTILGIEGAVATDRIITVTAKITATQVD